MGCLRMLAACSIFLIVSCDDGNKTTRQENLNGNDGHKETMAAMPNSRLGTTGTQLLMQVVEKYYKVKDALVATDDRLADSSATQLALSAEQLKEFLVKDTADHTDIATYVAAITEQSRLMNSINDLSCSKQRIIFEVISSNLYDVITDVKLKNAHIYHLHCPVAFSKRGACWLSNATEIKNPYFGKKLLECGEMADSLIY